tara:strand:+ start:646 stop:1242 length:597 start_codon:yes stop_codon:yes gene_type:complete
VSKKSKNLTLTSDDKTLWSEVIKTVKPLGERPEGKPLPPRRMVRRLVEEQPIPSDWHMHTAPDPTPTIDRKTKRKLTKGIQDVDRSIDLHGLTQDRAYGLLKSAVEGAVRRGDKTLLVVTGKGGARFSQTGLDIPTAYRTRDEFDQHGGVLKRMVPIWLNEYELKPFIQSYGPAAKEHGGDGALYILLRKRMPGSRRK